MTPTQILVLAAFFVLLVAYFVVPPFWRLVRWELSWDWRIMQFGLHAFILGAMLGGAAAFVIIAHYRFQIFGP